MLIILVAQFSFAQKIEQGFYRSVWEFKGEYGENLEILKNNFFRYRYWDDISNDIGFGKYSIIGNKLILNFLNYADYYDTNKVKMTDSITNKTDSIRIYLKIKNPVNKKLIDARIEYTLRNNVIIKAASDKKGDAILIISKNDLGGNLRITYVGYETFYYTITGDYDRNLNVKLEQYYKIIHKNEVKTFLIKDVDSEGFFVKNWLFTNWTFFKRED